VIEEVPDVAEETVDQELFPGSKSADSCDDPKMALKLKELDLSTRKQECEAQRIRLWAIEIKADRDIRLRQLDLQAQQLQINSFPVQSPARSMPDAQMYFDVSKHIVNEWLLI